MTIGITGATGHLGRLVIGKLKAKIPPARIIALARSPAKAADLGVTAREANYDKPETLIRSLAGIDTLLLISASEIGRRAAQHKNVVEAAKHPGVKRIIYTSLLHADTSSIGLADEHLASEADVKATGIPFTLLRNGWYIENYTASIPGALKNGAFIGSAGDGRLSLAARADFADAAVAVLTTDGHENAIYELAGDNAYTLTDLSAEISRQTGRTIPYRNLPEAEYEAALTGFGLPGPLAKAIAGWDVSASNGDLFDDSHQLSRLIGRPTTPLSTAVAEALKQGSLGAAARSVIPGSSTVRHSESYDSPF
jgi:NAD(P)H dehydrogenase (quinone)